MLLSPMQKDIQVYSNPVRLILSIFMGGPSTKSKIIYRTEYHLHQVKDFSLKVENPASLNPGLLH